VSLRRFPPTFKGSGEEDGGAILDEIRQIL
jgi:hypothetical protein